MALNEPKHLPVLPLRDMVIYPHGVHPLFVGTERSIVALERAMADSKEVLLIAKRDAESEPAKIEELFEMGTVATILQLLKLPDGTVKVLVEGLERARVMSLEFGDECIVAELETITSTVSSGESASQLVSELLTRFEKYVRLSKKVPQEVLASLSSIDDPVRLVDTVAAQMSLPVDQCQKILELTEVSARAELLLAVLAGELDVLKTEKRIRGRVKDQMEKSQREYYLNEQIKAIQKELGEMGESGGDVEELATLIEDAGMPQEAREKALAELGKLRQMAPMSAEATVVRSYLDWMIRIPWKKRSRLRKDLAQAQTILDHDHYGLEEVKERIIEYLAVQAKVGKIKGPVLCLVGPPGVGKTSLGESIARATNREFVRMALGGVRDEAEIRGHRRTYIGSMPGKVLQKMSKAGTRNPLFLFDEIDKMGMDFRGDPASALLEVLDPEQNNTFNDHYLEVDYDLSDVFFVCTSNSMNIPAALLDRMEVIRLPGYTEDEKLNIATRYLLPKQRELAGLKDGQLELTDDAIYQIVRYYTRESGVRGLEREIAKIARKVVTEQALQGDPKRGAASKAGAKSSASKAASKAGSKGKGRPRKTSAVSVTVDADQLEDYCGVRKFDFGLAEDVNRVGIVTGLAWTEVGGELLNIEAVAVPGKGKVVKTGSLGDVMQESIQAAITVVRSRSAALGIDASFHEKFDLHIHVPEGATPKDGPSAGVGMCTALASVFTRIPVRADVAMTGEITLRGQVLRIGGLKEKLLAAHRGGIREVIIPKENERDLKEIPTNVKQNLKITPVQWVDEVWDVALETQPAPSVEATADAVGSANAPAGTERGKADDHSISAH